MRLRVTIMSLILLASLIAGCTPTPTAPAGATIAPTTAVSPQFPTTESSATAPAATAQPTASAAAATATTSSPAVTQTATGAPPQNSALPGYIDDRSDAAALVSSLFNAISRKEYARAYTYWRSPTQTYDQFKQGYQDTDTVEVTTGPVGEDAGAGQRYYTVPVVLHSTKTGGQAEVYSGCYLLHLSVPGIQAAPPFQPLAVERASLALAAAGADPAALLAAGCQGGDIPQAPTLAPSPSPSPDDISSGVYLDNRSDPISVLRSLFNAVNRKEYARAYGYWKSGSSVPAFAQFEAGYAQTNSVSAAFGEPVGDAGAGQLRWRVPVALTVQTTGGQTQTFAGCYQLHISQPAVQDMVPFQPMGIERAQVTQLAAGADPSAQLSTVCSTMP